MSGNEPRQTATRIDRRGLMLVLSSPSGAGKTSISRRLVKDDDNLTMSVSMTTRAPRPGERDGVDYRFVSREIFEAHLRAGDMLEHAKVFDNYYGTPRQPIEAAFAAGRDILLDVDWQGTKQLAESSGADLASVFILPPSHDELEQRLHGRAQDSAAEVARRMAGAMAEISHWHEYDYVVVNQDFDRAVDEVKTILAAERLRQRRLVGLPAFVSCLREAR